MYATKSCRLFLLLPALWCSFSLLIANSVIPSFRGCCCLAFHIAIQKVIVEIHSVGFGACLKGGELQMREVGHNFIAVNTVEDVNNGLYL